MKKRYLIDLVFIVCIVASVAIIILNINLEENAVSTIDNRLLSPNPLKTEGAFSRNLENYIDDRIGFRNNAIKAYVDINADIFGVLEHPDYEFGQNKEIFFSNYSGRRENSDYYKEFATMVSNINVYCEDRGIDFLFVMEPLKNSIERDKIPDGINYDNSWKDLLFEEITEAGIDSVDNSIELQQLYDSNIAIYNKRADVGHWNDVGAFYGCNNILKAMSKKYPGIHINEIDEFDIESKIEQYLPTSEYDISEEVPVFEPKISVKSIAKNYADSLKISEEYGAFNYYINDARDCNNSPRVLMFQISYMNMYGWKFMANALNEYAYVHSYDNIYIFDYYIELFNPDYVIFEVAEYSCMEWYFPLDSIKSCNERFINE